MSAPLLRVEGLSVRHPSSDGGWLGARPGPAVVHDVSFTLNAGETLALVGESGSGKSSLARAVLRLGPGESRVLELEGRPIGSLSERELRPLRRRMQPVFQDAGAALDPNWSVRALVREGLDIHGLGSAAERDARVDALLAEVGLPAVLASSRPGELSGGQKQRVGIARALALDPVLLVADEPVSALDVAVQAQVLNLLMELQERRGLGLLLVTHDLGLVPHVADRVAVLLAGRIVEEAPIAAFVNGARHPHSRALLAAAPKVAGGPRLPVAVAPVGERSTNGCPWAPRCAAANERCRSERPELGDVASSTGQRVACHAVEEGRLP